MYVYGKNVANEILKDQTEIKKAIVSNNFSDKDILRRLNNLNIRVEYRKPFELDRLVDGNHQGIILEVKDYEYADIDELLVDESPLLVILDHLEDPHNFGAIIRTCESAGVDGIIIPKNRSVDVNSTVMKTSTGALNHMKITQVTNLKNTIDYLKKQGFWIVGTDMEGTDYTSIDYKTKIAIVIGNEGKGISRLVGENCDYLAKIPMNGTVNSLNASVACGIFLSEITRSRRV